MCSAQSLGTGNGVELSKLFSWRLSLSLPSDGCGSLWMCVEDDLKVDCFRVSNQ